MTPETAFPLLPLVGPIVTIVLAFLGFVVGVWKLVSWMQSREIKAAKEAADQAKAAAEAVAARVNEAEKELLRLRAQLPLDYVRREDWIRNQTVIEAKLDGLASKLENIKEARNVS
jgi:Na+-transporting methylmalonyl-CoA/oxaloacetate decarboxylase gamma subunit